MAEDSLSRRLAGQSVNKAGLCHDQSEINRIIVEASRGSKFYEAERKKDAELTEKITKLLALRDDMMNGVDIAKVEAGVDHTIAELESGRDLSQVICHVDCDAFYASVEVLDDPSLAGKAFGVSHGVLSTASYEARKYGVRSAMPTFIAKKLCPELILVHHHFDRYKEMSKQVMDVLRIRDPNMAMMSMDEAYLNITEYCHLHNLSPEECVQQMRDEVFEKTKLTVSAGIAPNKMLAKICSDKNKPNGQFMMPFDKDSIMSFMKDLSIRKVPGIGKVSERLYEGFGIKTCADVYRLRASICIMDHHLGLVSLLKAYLGIASNNVEPGKREERKSVGAERTFHPTSDLDVLLQKLEYTAESLERDMERNGWAGKTITLKYKLDTYRVYTRAKSMNKYITSKEDFFAIGKELLMKEVPVKLRLIGLRATQLKDLRASDDTGIKKFFGKQQEGSPPSKKRKITKDPSFILISSEDEAQGDDGDDGDDDGVVEMVDGPLRGVSPAPSTPAPDDTYTGAKPSFFDLDEDMDDNDKPAQPSIFAKPAKASRAQLYAQPSSKPAPVPSLITDRPKPLSASSVPNRSQSESRAVHPPALETTAAGSSSSSRVASNDLKRPRARSSSSKPWPSPQKPKPQTIDMWLSKQGKSAPRTETMTCPICQRELETNNIGMNEHIDLCLSKGEIKRASGESSKSRSSIPKTSKGTSKSGRDKRLNPFAKS